MPISSYFVDFIAHIDETRRPENFPHEIHDKQVYEVESLAGLQFRVNERFVQLISSSGMVVMKDDTEIVDEGKIAFSNRMYIPWHLISHLTLEINMMPAKPNTQDSIVSGHVLPDKPKEWSN